eukprot:gnl/MRDRNA2_/MRDRNA2_94776_c0_seq1.p1 gnl/MRDRNA2_/MRDRNA2_94776_c0~~gnl/MRDRNA2_/MRDRNA2_94776_c0_seq1.p1  ORF type:complete len:374 (-),score=93.68 gnl/MRDRNA2_/MRDRNA2_94776_c0_seq1:248-1369(-)
MDCQLIRTPNEQGEAIAAGSSVQWVLANSGSMVWPDMTTLRLIGGPTLMEPVLAVPPAAPGQTVVIDLEVSETDEEADVFYALVTPDGQPFGEIVHAKVVPKEKPAAPKPVCAIFQCPGGEANNPVDAMQGEVKQVEWVVANIGSTAWPNDVTVTLFYNTPGLSHIPTVIDVPSGVAAGMTVQIGAAIIMPEKAGHFKAMWALTSPSSPEFGEILHAEFCVDDFPFMEWMAVEKSQAEEPVVPQKLSMVVSMQNHLLPGHGEVKYDEEVEKEGIVSLGCVTGLRSGDSWIQTLVLTNDGDVPWPENVALRNCFGDAMGCDKVCLDGQSVQVGESIQLQMELCLPRTPCKAGWVLACGEGDGQTFGPALLLAAE